MNTGLGPRGSAVGSGLCQWSGGCGACCSRWRMFTHRATSIRCCCCIGRHCSHYHYHRGTPTGGADKNTPSPARRRSVYQQWQHKSGLNFRTFIIVMNIAGYLVWILHCECRPVCLVFRKFLWDRFIATPVHINSLPVPSCSCILLLVYVYAYAYAVLLFIVFLMRLS